MGRLFRLACLVFCALCGCGNERELPWLEVNALAPELLDPGTVLRVSGSSLPAGHAGTARFEGETRRPGRSPLSVRAELPARAPSDDRLEILFDEAALCALGCAGTFEGKLTVRFAVQRSAGAVTGSLPARLDLRGPQASGPGVPELRARARRVLEHAGIEPLEEASALSGLVVRAVREGSPAAELGLVAGEVIARAEGVTVHGLSDLVPAPSARRVTLEVRGGASTRIVVLDLSGLFGPDLRAELERLSWLLSFVLLCALWLSPLPSGAWLLERLRGGGAHQLLPALALWGGTRRVAAGPVAWMREAALPLGLSAGGVALVYLQPGVLAVRSLSLYLGLAALSVTLTLISESDSLRNRLRAAGSILGRMLVTGLLIACACALYGSRSFDGMVQSQGGWPWRFGAFQKPALLVALPLYVVFASRLGATTLALEPQGRVAHLLVLERVLTNVALSALGVAIFFGGWQFPGELAIEGVQPRFAGAVAFVGKAWAFGVLLAWARRGEAGVAISSLPLLLGCALSVVLTAVWLWLEPSPSVELAVGRALCGSLALYACLCSLTAARKRLSRWASASDTAAKRKPTMA